MQIEQIGAGRFRDESLDPPVVQREGRSPHSIMELFLLRRAGWTCYA